MSVAEDAEARSQLSNEAREINPGPSISCVEGAT